MRYSKLFGKTLRTDPKDEVSTNAKLLIRAGFVRKEMAGVYNYLPLGLRVLEKVSNIVREEMKAAGGQELLLAALQNKENWKKTGRWDSFDALFKIQSRYEFEYALGPSHEEVLVPIVAHMIDSYKDLPLSIYQIQTKFRDEARAKSGILRGREFIMKDLYSFHTDEEDFNTYYDRMRQAYKTVFKRCGLDTIETEASGGTFSKFSHEYQVITEAGEDEIIYCPGGDFSQNTEIAKVTEGKQCDLGHGPLKKAKTIEVGNIFPLKTRFSEAFNLTYKDKDGKEQFVVMGCYGIGINRIMGTVVEVHNDDKGIKWPSSVSPYQAHLVTINTQQLTVNKANEAYEKLTKAGVEVLYDDREDVTAGEKFADADLIGIPVRLVVSEKTQDKVEWKNRDSDSAELISTEEAIQRFKRAKTEEKD